MQDLDRVAGLGLDALAVAAEAVVAVAHGDPRIRPVADLGGQRFAIAVQRLTLQQGLAPVERPLVLVVPPRWQQVASLDAPGLDVGW